MSKLLARSRLAAAQAEVMRALCRGGPVPPDFDARGVAAEGRALARKRRHLVMKWRPALARALGPHLDATFTEYASAHAYRGHIEADAWAFAHWFEERLDEDEGTLASIDWRPGVRALVAARRREHDMSRETREDLAQVQALLAKVVTSWGSAVLESPRIRVALAVASFEALGADLGEIQRSELGRALLEELPPSAPEEPAPATLVAAALAVLRVNARFERILLERILRPRQRARYLESVGDDPFPATDMPRMTIAGPTRQASGEALAALWLNLAGQEPRTFGEESQAVVHTCALEFVCAALSLPDTAHEPDLVRKREGALERAVRVLELQAHATDKLSQDITAPRKERALAAQRLASVLVDVREPSTDGHGHARR
jgi:hypothetical protein